MKGFYWKSPETEKDLILLKLNNGYNIGFKKKEVFEIKVVEKGEDKKEDVEFSVDKKKPNVAMIITGGTIAARLNPKKGGVDWLTSPEALFKYYPGIFDKVNLIKVEVPFMKASEDMDYKDWQKLAKVSEKLLNDKNVEG